MVRPLLVFLPVLCAICCRAQDAEIPFRPDVPRVWDEQALREMELPVVVPKYSPKAVSADYYYRIPVRKIYRSYPIYAPGRAPAGYLSGLRTQ